ncbi:MAG: Bax inhibitor-1/YccA family protein [Ornithinimicrobium sp.]
MANNPVFNRIDRETRGYAGFGNGPQAGGAQHAPPRGAPRQGPPAPMGYGGPSESMSNEQLEQMYGQAPAGPQQTGRLTLDDVIMKSLMLFSIVVAVAGAAWFMLGPVVDPASGNLVTNPLAMPVWLIGMFGSLGLSFAIAFSKKVNVPLIMVHAVLQGAFLGAISVTFNAAYPGIVSSAVLATMGTFAGMFLAWKIGFIKVTSKSRRIFGMMAMGYLVFMLINIGSSLLGFGNVYASGGILAIVICLFGVGMASYSLAIDFDSIDRAVGAGAPEKYSWLLGHGLVASLVWLYIEFLRLFAVLQND